MRTDKIIFISTMTAITLILVSIFMYPNTTEQHDHRVYTRTWANGHRSTLFTICGDSTVVSSTGKHWGFIPQSLEGFINKDNRVR